MCATPNSQIHLEYSSQFMTLLLGNATNLEEYLEKVWELEILKKWLQTVNYWG